MRERLAVVILAAGEGKRMKSALPKVLHRAAGRSLVGHVVAAASGLGAGRVVVVSPPGKNRIAETLVAEGVGAGLEFVIQDPPRGTGDAARIALSDLGQESDSVLVLPGDSPLLTTETLRALVDEHQTSKGAVTLLSAQVTDPAGYGRLVRDQEGRVVKVVEERDASPDEVLVHEISSSVYVFDRQLLASALRKIDDDNSQGEFYLTDVVESLVSEGEVVSARRTEEREVRGVNSRVHLAQVAAALRRRTAERLMVDGVTIVDPATTYIDETVSIASDAVIHPFTILEGDTSIGARAEVGPQARVVSSSIEEDAVVSYSVVVESSIGPEATVGPFASLRPGTRLERGAKLGTFVEAKNTVVGEGSKANHLSYLGDARLGKGVNVGAGTVTCNWDGRNKHETVIDDDAYISSDTMLVAPVRVGKRAATGAGAVVREDVPDGALAVGAPARNIEGKGDRMAHGGGAGEEPERVKD